MTTSADGGKTAATPPDSATSTTAAPKPVLIEEALERLARGSPTDFASLLHDVERHAVINGTNVTAHCHCLKLDGNGRPRVAALVEAVAEHVLDYAIPRSEYRAAREEAESTGLSQKVVRLHTKARKLFTDLVQSGEGGELLLFALAEKLLRLPQLICKMSLKTNARMHIHGADGLHAGVDEKTGKLLLYWGESKIYGDVTGAVRECLGSLAPMLQDHETNKRDLQLLQRHLDVDDEGLENALRRFLDPDDPAFNSLEFRGLCLVGFDFDAYPKDPSKAELKAVVDTITSTLPTWKSHVAKRVSDEKLNAFSMHFLFVPFPSADEFRRLFREHLGLNTETDEAAPEAPTPRPTPAAATLIPAAAASSAASVTTKRSRTRRNNTPPTSQGRRTLKPKGRPRGAP